MTENRKSIDIPGIFVTLDISLHIHLLGDHPKFLLCIIFCKKNKPVHVQHEKKNYTQLQIPTHAHMETGFDNAKR